MFAAGLAALPLSIAQAQYYPQYYPPCSPFPLTWPLCVVGAAVGIAVTIVTLPMRVLTGGPTLLLWLLLGYPITRHRPITHQDIIRRLITGRAEPRASPTSHAAAPALTRGFYDTGYSSHCRNRRDLIRGQHDAARELFRATLGVARNPMGNAGSSIGALPHANPSKNPDTLEEPAFSSAALNASVTNICLMTIPAVVMTEKEAACRRYEFGAELGEL